MLVFIIPIKSAQISKSWDSVCQLLERTVRSIFNQTDSNFKVIIVCNEKPKIHFEHPSLHFVEINSPVPKTAQDRQDDRAKKAIAGLRYARQFSPNHVMFVDSDDCVSRRIVAFANQHPDADGWYVNSGYVYQEGSRWIYYRKSDFQKWCGTCHIIRFALCPIPDGEDDYPEDSLKYYALCSHRNFNEVLKQTPPQPLPFPGTVYIIGHGDNDYQTGFGSLHNANRGNLLFKLKETLKFRPISPSIRQEFGLYSLSSPYANRADLSSHSTKPGANR